MLTDELSQRLAAADRSLQRERGTLLALHALRYVLAALLALFALDVIWHLAAGRRVVAGLAFLGGLLALAAGLFHLAQVRRNRPEHVARLLESRDSTLGSRLINFLQLRAKLHEPGTTAPLTHSLAERAVGAYAAALQMRDFTALTRSPTRRRDFRVAGAVMGSVLLLLAILYPVTLTELLRFADPFGDHPAYSFTQIEITEPADGAQVDYNGQIVIKARTSGHRPDDLFLRLQDPAHPGEARTLPMYSKGELGFVQAVEGVRTDLLVTATTKNGRSVSKSRRLQVGLVPKIERAWVQVTAPAYTGLEPRETAFDFKNLTVLAGSQVRWRLHSNRPLASGLVTPAEGAAVPLAPSAESEVSGTLTAIESTRLQFSVIDRQGYASQENPSAPLTVTHDLPPEITIDTPAQDGFVCDDFVVEAKISASDDYGLKTIRLHRALNEVFSPPETITFAGVTRSSSPTATFDIKNLGVQPGDTISLFAEAVDTCPEPHLARTRTLRLMVISTEEYNDYLRERTDISDIQGKYTTLLNEFHDDIDEQKELAEQIRALQEKAKDPANAKETGPALDKLMAQQAELNQKLGALADHMDKFVRDQPLYDLETELQKTLSETAEKIRSSVAENDKALREELRKSGQAGASPQEQLDALASLGQEAQQQAERLQPEQQAAAEEILPPLKDAALMNAMLNDLNAIKYLHETQSTVAEQARAYAERETPTDEDKLALKQLAGTEKALEWALQKVVDNLRDHADAAETVFPKAAAGARDLAETVEKQRLSSLAARTAQTMLAGSAGESSALADRLLHDLADLFEEGGKPREGPMQQEFDQYLKLRRGMKSANTFGQMSKSRKFGLGQGQGSGQGRGQGQEGGLDGYASSTGGDFGLFGNETLGGDPKSAGQGQGGQAKAAGPGRKVDATGTDTATGAETNRLSGSTTSEAAMDEYRSVIEAYFNSITQ